MADQSVLRSLLTLTISLMLLILYCVDKTGTTSDAVTHNFAWSGNVSTLYPPSSPLKVKFGDKLNIKCPPDGISNIWIQTDLRQYEMCDCNATGVEDPDCSASAPVQQVCQDEVHIAITINSNELTSALSFELGTYYLISYSPGNAPRDGYSEISNGGECLDGYKMVMSVQSQADPSPTTKLPPPPATESTDNDSRPTDIEDLFTTGGDLGDYSSATSTTTLGLQPTPQRPDHSTIIRWTGIAFGAVIILLLIVLITFTVSFYRCKRTKSWTLPGTQNAAYVTNTSEADAIYDEIDTKDGPQVARNVAYGTSSCQEVSMKENAQYDTVPNRGLMSENAGYYGTSTFVSKTNGDGQVNDNMD